MSYIERLDTVLLAGTAAAPPNAVPAVGGSNELNYRLKGKSSYLVAVRTNDKAAAARWFEIIQYRDAPSELGRAQNFNEGTDIANYRYLITKKRTGPAADELRVVDVKLFRGVDAWRGSSGYKRVCDFNEGRGGDYLWLGARFG